MDNRPIGFFDSGLGGLTSIPYLRKHLPNEKVIYFGDTARTPYGSKSPKTITNFACQIADFLVESDVKMIVIACNTISATCLDVLRERYPHIPIVGIIEPAATRTARICAIDNVVGVIGTKATIRSHAYESLIHAHDGALEVHELACPAFVPLIEEGIINSDIMDLTIHHYLDDFILENRIDTLILGCTHYPLVESHIRRMHPNLRIINPSEVVVDTVEEILKDRNAFADGTAQDVENCFYASDLSDNFIAMIDRIFEDSNEKVAFKNLDV
ncbi:MAG: glutamate racemase [Clostridiales bacterium]|nr:glutamate racemase [Clostridiales bacterium]